MDSTDWLKHVTAGCRVLGRPDEALRVLPDLGVDGPVLAELRLEGGVVRCFPAQFSRALQRPVGQTLERLLVPLLAGKPAENPGALDVTALQGEPLVQALASILAEGAPLGSRAASVAVLELARSASKILDGDLDELQKAASDQTARLRGPIGQLGALEIGPRGQALSAIAVSLLARISAAFSLAARFDPRVVPGRIFQAMVRNRVALVIPAGGLDPAADLPLVASVAGTRADGAVVSSVFLAVRAAIAASLDQQDNVAAQGLRDLARDRKDPQVLALDPLIAEYVLTVMGSLTDVKTLERASVNKTLAKAMMKGEGVAAMAASFAEVANALRVWDLLSSLAALCLPIYADGTRRTTPQGAIDAPGPWAFLGPRGDGGVVTGALVVLRATGLSKAVAAAAKKPESVLAQPALRRLWLNLEQEARNRRGLLDFDSTPARAVFVDADGANGFLDVARRAFALPIRLPMAPYGPDLELLGDIEVKLQSATGELVALWDTERLYLSGPLVEEMLAGGGDATASAGKNVAGLEELFKAASQKSAASSPAADPFSGRSPSAPDAPSRSADPFAAATDPPPAGSDRAPNRPRSLPPKPEPTPPKAAEPLVAPPRLPEPPAPAKPPAPSAKPADPFATESVSLDPFAPSAKPADPFAASSKAPPPDPFAASTSAPRDDAADPFVSLFSGPRAEAPSAAKSTPPEFAFKSSAPEPPPKADPFAPKGADPFAGGLSLQPTDADPFATAGPRETMTPVALPERPAPAPKPPPKPEPPPASAGAILSMEIEDSDEEDEDEAPNALTSPELFFLPPPPSSSAPKEAAQSAARPIEQDLDALFGLRNEAPKAAVPRMGAQEISYMFEGYVTFEGAGERIVFGRRYGQKIIDSHDYPASRGLEDAYRSFARDKVKEGFAPQSDRGGSIPAGAQVAQLDMDRIARALSELA